MPDQRQMLHFRSLAPSDQSCQDTVVGDWGSSTVRRVHDRQAHRRHAPFDFAQDQREGRPFDSLRAGRSLALPGEGAETALNEVIHEVFRMDELNRYLRVSLFPRCGYAVLLILPLTFEGLARTILA